MNYIQCPDNYIEKSEYTVSVSIFLAGGISNCYNWQDNIVELFRNKKYGDHIALINPRRENFDKTIPGLEKEQIEWEHKHLKLADIILFWFPSETVCPITLYELGTWSSKEKHIFLGIDKNYERRLDVEIQTKLVRPEIKIVYDLESLCEQIDNNIKDVAMEKFWR
ncbi:MAG: nucleoside 2-deoxyribosyltransferase domain-containing protein [Candidatus Woesearchaeota archaeon]|jgi:hypothetical protein